MPMPLYSLNSIGGSFGVPFVSLNDGLACDAVVEVSTTDHLPCDCALYRVGSFDFATGKVHGLKSPRKVKVFNK